MQIESDMKVVRNDLKRVCESTAPRATFKQDRFSNESKNTRTDAVTGSVTKGTASALHQTQFKVHKSTPPDLQRKRLKVSSGLSGSIGFPNGHMNPEKTTSSNLKSHCDDYDLAETLGEIPTGAMCNTSLTFGQKKKKRYWR